MDLHRASGKPDWYKVESKNLNTFQRLALKTNGLMTPANVISVIGPGLVVYGLWMIIDSQVWLGVVLVVVGRLLDLADGMVSEATKTKSPLGEMVDAVADKLATLLTIITLIVANVTDWWVILILVAPQLLISLVIFLKRQKGVSIHPTRSGKLSMALVWIGVAGLLVAHGLDESGIFNLVNYLVVAASAILGFVALWQYSKSD